MGLPSKNDLKFWQGVLFNKDDWDFNFSQIVSWLADGTSDLVINSLKATNGIDLDGARISNVGEAQSGSDAISLDQANTILNRSSYYYPFSVASGKVDTSTGKANYITKNSDTEIVIEAGNTNPDLVCIMSDGTIESVTSDVTLTVPGSDGTYYIIKEKGSSIALTGGSAKVTISPVAPTSPSIGDYWLNNSVVPFVGRKSDGGWLNAGTIQPFCLLGYVTVSSGAATVFTPNYNDNYFDFNSSGSGWVAVDQEVNNATSVSTSAASISSYIPNDGSYYECLFRYYISTSNTTNSYYKVRDNDKNIVYVEDGADAPANGNLVYEGGQVIAFVKSTTTLNVEISGHAFHSTSLRLLAYRKINTEVL